MSVEGFHTVKTENQAKSKVDKYGLTAEQRKDLQQRFENGKIQIGQKFITPEGTLARFDGWIKGYGKQIIAGKGSKRGIDEIDTLTSKYPSGEAQWQKCKRPANVTIMLDATTESERGIADLHWYEEPTIGVVKRKVKVDDYDGTWFYPEGEMPHGYSQ